MFFNSKRASSRRNFGNNNFPFEVSSTDLHDELIDNTPENGTNYYRLQSHDFDGKIFQQGIVSIDVNEFTIYYNQATASIELSENSTIEIYATDGRRITQSTNSKHIPFHHSGVFLVHDTDTGKTVRILIK
mgnify:CR=1 FL=1